MHRNLIASLQERAARAQPAEHAELAGGWLLRHAPQTSWWISSVLPHARTPEKPPLGTPPPGMDLAGRVAHAERFYAARGAAARFQITPGACPDGLDAFLESRGYLAHSPVSLQIADACAIPSPPTGFDIVIEEEATHAVIKALLGHEVVSRAKAVPDNGWTGIFAMTTVPAARGRGAARAVLGALARWAPTGRLYLQVECDNSAAQALYRRAGFTQLCQYRYRSMR